MSTPAPPLPEPSAVTAAQEAYGHTRRVLFPFRFEHWLTLGVVAFLEQCGRGGLGGVLPGAPPGVPFPSTSGDWPSRGAADVGDWFTAHLAVIVVVAVCAFAVAVLLIALAVWIGSRATFVYIDDVVTGRAELSAPWRAHAEKAQSYFAWRFGLAAALLGAVALLVIGAVFAVFLIAKGGLPGAGAGSVILVALVPVFLLVLLAGGLGAMALRDFVAPLQMVTPGPCAVAVQALVVLVRAHPLPFFIYVVLRIVFEIVRGFAILVSACFTLCCTLVPVVTQTALQPLFFFERAWPLFFLRQMGHDVLARSTEAPPGVGSQQGAAP